MRRFAKPLYGLTPVPRVRIPASPPHSLDCREILLALPPKHACSARILRLFADKPHCGERTARHVSALAFLRKASVWEVGAG